MNIEHVKEQIRLLTKTSLPVLDMSQQFEEVAAAGGEPLADGKKAIKGQILKVPQPWLSHWDNINRIRVTMHEEVFNQIVADKTFDGLAVKQEAVPATMEADGITVKREAYTRFVVITPTAIRATF